MFKALTYQDLSDSLRKSPQSTEILAAGGGNRYMEKNVVDQVISRASRSIAEIAVLAHTHFHFIFN